MGLTNSTASNKEPNPINSIDLYDNNSYNTLSLSLSNNTNDTNNLLNSDDLNDDINSEFNNVKKSIYSMSNSYTTEEFCIIDKKLFDKVILTNYLSPNSDNPLLSKLIVPLNVEIPIECEKGYTRKEYKLDVVKCDKVRGRYVFVDGSEDLMEKKIVNLSSLCVENFVLFSGGEEKIVSHNYLLVLEVTGVGVVVIAFFVICFIWLFIFIFLVFWVFIFYFFCFICFYKGIEISF